MPRPPQTKWLVVLLIWTMMLVAYMDRVNISFASEDIRRELHLGLPQFGSILAAFSLGYAFMQIPGGWLSDRLGSKPLLVAGLLAWSLFTGLTGICSSLISLVAIRFLFGMGEGLENGAQFKLIGDHFTARERSRANGIFLSSLALGPALAVPISSALLLNVGWRNMFLVFAGVGVIVAAILAAFLPKEKPQKPSKPTQPNHKRNLIRPQVGILLIGYLMFNIAFWGFVGWTPTYLREHHHISLNHLGWIGAVPYLCGFVGLLLTGQLGSRLYELRPFLVSGCYLAAAAFLYFALSSSSFNGCIVSLSIASFFLYAAFAPFWAMAIDLAKPEERGGLTGLVNFGGQLGGFLGQWMVGIIAGNMHNFNAAILSMSFSLVIGAAVILLVRRFPLNAPLAA